MPMATTTPTTANVFMIGPLGPSVVIRDLRHRNLAPQRRPYRELFDRLLKRLVLVLREHRAQLLEERLPMTSTDQRATDYSESGQLEK